MNDKGWDKRNALFMPYTRTSNFNSIKYKGCRKPSLITFHVVNNHPHLDLCIWALSQRPDCHSIVESSTALGRWRQEEQEPRSSLATCRTQGEAGLHDTLAQEILKPNLRSRSVILPNCMASFYNPPSLLFELFELLTPTEHRAFSNWLSSCFLWRGRGRWLSPHSRAKQQHRETVWALNSHTEDYQENKNRTVSSTLWLLQFPNT